MNSDPKNAKRETEDEKKADIWEINEGDRVRFIGDEEKTGDFASNKKDIALLLNGDFVVSEIDYSEVDCILTSDDGQRFFMYLDLIRKA